MILKMELTQIGVIHTPYKTLSECPHQTCKSEQIAEIEVYDDYVGGLKDVEGFSHILILYWLHKATGYSLLVRTPWDAKPHGLFTTRSPRRPNPIGSSVVELIERRGHILRIKGIDAIDGSPLIDIKPYVPEFNEKGAVKIGWLEGKV
uniref:S-adenosyl-L-methionine-binding protein n=1 Tax=Candidatus Methanophaga sp. ANME-1 ERB7 TaxID=2759913 RepID=A0A7G9Z1V7_9EURY|nr:S-adenosyl-L-methionine-binding protein [Methanosarcinales archaeon ANME-1 ERB7]